MALPTAMANWTPANYQAMAKTISDLIEGKDDDFWKAVSSQCERKALNYQKLKDSFLFKSSQLVDPEDFIWGVALAHYRGTKRSTWERQADDNLIRRIANVFSKYEIRSGQMVKPDDMTVVRMMKVAGPLATQIIMNLESSTWAEVAGCWSLPASLPANQRTGDTLKKICRIWLHEIANKTRAVKPVIPITMTWAQAQVACFIALTKLDYSDEVINRVWVEAATLFPGETYFNQANVGDPWTATDFLTNRSATVATILSAELENALQAATFP